MRGVQTCASPLHVVARHDFEDGTGLHRSRPIPGFIGRDGKRGATEEGALTLFECCPRSSLIWRTARSHSTIPLKKRYSDSALRFSPNPTFTRHATIADHPQRLGHRSERVRRSNKRQRLDRQQRQRHSPPSITRSRPPPSKEGHLRLRQVKRYVANSIEQEERFFVFEQAETTSTAQDPSSYRRAGGIHQEAAGGRTGRVVESVGAVEDGAAGWGGGDDG